MATNKPYGDNARKGEVRKRSQLRNKKIKRFIKRSRLNGQFMDVKSDGKKWKGVKKER